MFLKPKKVKIEKDFTARVGHIEVPKTEIDRINQQIINNVRQKEIEREKIMETAKFPRVRLNTAVIYKSQKGDSKITDNLQNLFQLMIEDNYHWWRDKLSSFSTSFITKLSESVDSSQKLSVVRNAYTFPEPSEQHACLLLNPKYSTQQMEQIMLGLRACIPICGSTDVSKLKLYCSPNFSAEQMEQVRLGIKDNLNNQQLYKLADCKLPASAMQELRQQFDKENKIARLQQIYNINMSCQ